MTIMQLKHEHARFVRKTENIRKQIPIPTLHALLIGIDSYKNFTKLSGAVKDAESVSEFLRTDLGVPESQITKLTNDQATRSGIISAMERLSKDTRINQFDPIIIFYAGHGCEVDSPLEDYKEKAQCLVPCDLGQPGADGQPIPPIPDYTLSALFNEIAIAKGNNITVIFDSCHSASSTRGVRTTSTKAGSQPCIQTPTSNVPIIEGTTPVTYRARSLNLTNLPSLTHETDKEIIQRVQRRRRWRVIIALIRSHLLFMRVYVAPQCDLIGNRAPTQRSLSKSVPELLGFSRSHILLAACGHAEQSYECAECDCGFFTTTLLQVLRSSWIQKLRYKWCFEEFPKLLTPGPQSPVCEGDTTGRLLFTVPALRILSHTDSYSIRKISGDYLMRLGDAQGIFPGSKYGIYEDYAVFDGFGPVCSPSPSLDSPLWGFFTAYPFTSTEPTFYPFYSRCKLDNNDRLPNWPRARLLQLGSRGIYSLRVFFSDSVKLFLDPGTLVNAEEGIVLVDSVDLGAPGTVVLDIENGHSGLVTIGVAGFPRVLHKCNPEAKRIRRIIISMAQWWWHRSREPENTPKQSITAEVSMYRLGEGGPSLLPIGKDNSVTVEASPTTLYALKMKSRFHSRLYAYLFYFSTARQSIRPLYLGVYGSQHIDPSFEPYGELTCGYFNDDMIPGSLSFGPTPDDGYFKLFLTTAPGDFDSLGQPSPFIDPRTHHAISARDSDQYGDGLESRKHSPLACSGTGLSTAPDVCPIALGGHSIEVLHTEVLGANLLERQQVSKKKDPEYSERASLPESTVLELLAAQDIELEAARWGVVGLKVKCRRFSLQ